MKLKNLNLHNYGIYNGDHEIDFMTNKDKNVVLIHGKNGSGKTTILNAIKIALYGPAFLGYKRQNKKYLSFIERKINNNALIDESIDKYYLSLELELIEDGEYISYTFTRDWYKTDYNNIRENFILKREGKILSEALKEKFMTSFLSSIPYTLFNLYFFDGEKIDELFVSDQNTNSIKKMFDIIFNLELFNILDIDLKNYIVQKNIYDDLEDYEREYIELRDKQNNLINKIEGQEAKILDINESLLLKSDELKNLEKKYEVNEGLMVDEKNAIYNDISKLMKEKNLLKSKFDEIVLEYLPFLLLKESINKLISTIEEEKINDHKKYLRDSINNNDFNEFLESKNIKNKDELELLLTEYFNVNNIENKYSFNKDEEHVINHLNKSINKIDREQFISDINRIEDINKKLLTKKKIYEKNLSEEFTSKLNEINKIRNEIEKINLQKEELIIDIEENRSYLEDLCDEIKSKKADIRDAKKDGSVFDFTDQIQNVISLYKEKISKVKVDELSKYTTQIFKKLIRKDDFIKEIIIDDHLDISIINKNDQIVHHENLSSGETQIYVLSLLWGMIKVSNRKIPLVFDTLLGRLDKSHKASIIREFMDDISDQIIILATDSEVDDEHYDLLKDRINKEYTLDYNNLKSDIKSA